MGAEPHEETEAAIDDFRFLVLFFTSRRDSFHDKTGTCVPCVCANLCKDSMKKEGRAAMAVAPPSCWLLIAQGV